MGNPNKCANCEEQAAHKHHIVPKSLGGTDQLSNLVDLCESCHGLVHEQSFLKNKSLQKIGIEKAKSLGKYTGRKPTARLKYPQVLHLYEEGCKIKDIVNKLGISRASVYRVLDSYLPSWKTREVSDPCDDWSKLGESYGKA